MEKRNEKHPNWARFTAWVDGEREPRDQTLYIMEHRPPRRARPSEAEQEDRARARMREFFNWQPTAAVVLSFGLTMTLLLGVEPLLDHDGEILLVMLFGMGLFTALLCRNLGKKLVGFDGCALSGCALLTLLSPQGWQSALCVLGLLAALNVLAVWMLRQLYRRAGTLELKELSRRTEREEE